MKIIEKTLSILSVGCCTLLTASGIHTPRIWTDQEGRTIGAVFVSHAEETISIRRTLDNRLFTIPVSMLCDEDQNWVRQSSARADHRQPTLPVGMQILPLTNLSSQYDKAALDQLETILRGNRIDTTISAPEQTFNLFKDIRFLEPLRQAETKLGLSMGSRAEVNTPGFNPSSFYFHVYHLNLNSALRPFNRIYLVTDRAEQVVAVQLSGGSDAAEQIGQQGRSGYTMGRIIDFQRKMAAGAKIYWSTSASMFSNREPARLRNSTTSPSQAPGNSTTSPGYAPVVILRSSFYSSQNRPLYGNELYLPRHLGAILLRNIQEIRKAAVQDSR